MGSACEECERVRKEGRVAWWSVESSVTTQCFGTYVEDLVHWGIYLPEEPVAFEDNRQAPR